MVRDKIVSEFTLPGISNPQHLMLKDRTLLRPCDADGILIYAEDSIIPASFIDPTGKLNIGRAIVHTGIAIQLPSGTVGKIASRSGLSTKHNIEVGAGWIDNDYRGELVVELKNFSSLPYQVKIGERIAQIIILNITDTKMIVSENLDLSDRGEKGFGSSGK
jgi:dUTP pyrophosphatase